LGEAIIVGVAEVKGTREASDILIAPSLGSGVGVCAYDPQERVAAIAYFLLPESRGDESAPGKYADTAIPSLLERIVELGADPERVRVALVGGAQLGGFRGAGIRLEIGARNVSAAQALLEQANIPIVAADIGGIEGRTLHMTTDGRVHVRAMGKRDRELVHLGLPGGAPSRAD